jgi:MFS superfamily sulfate permease-like transporter
MAPSWKEWTRSDIVYGIVVPVVVVLLIVSFSQLGSLLGRGSFGFVMGITSGIAEAIVIVGVPMLLGLAWNQWAGGCSGFC